MKILLTGAAGMLGRDLTLVLTDAGHQVLGVDVDDFDIADRESVENYFAECAAECCVHSAAYTDVDGSEDDETVAFLVNVDGTANLARACAHKGMPIYCVSTDYVFSGDAGRPYLEDDSTEPLGAYGRSKLAGEEAVKEHNTEWCVLRTCGLYGRYGKNFIDTILTRGRMGEELKIVSDQNVSPTWTVEFARALLVVLEKSARGVYHLTSTGQCSWYEFATEAFRLSGISGEGLKKIASDDLVRKAKRPQFSALANDKLRGLGYGMAGWQEALAEYLTGK